MIISFLRINPGRLLPASRSRDVKLLTQASGREETLTLIWKQNQDCSEKLMTNGDSFVWSRIWGQEVAGNVMHLPSPPRSGSQVWIWTGDQKARCFSFGDICPGFSGTVLISYNLIIFNEGNLLDMRFFSLENMATALTTNKGQQLERQLSASMGL